MSDRDEVKGASADERVPEAGRSRRIKRECCGRMASTEPGMFCACGYPAWRAAKNPMLAELECARDFLRKAWDEWSVDAAADLIRFNLQGCPQSVRMEADRMIAKRRQEVTR